jgi:hypothetical protein
MPPSTIDPRRPSVVSGVLGKSTNQMSQPSLQQIPEEGMSMASDRGGLKGSFISTQARPFNENDAIFERMIIIIPYKAPETVMQIEQSFERINM